MSETEVNDSLDIAITVIEAAGDIALAHFRRLLALTDKFGGGHFDPVTNADREIERFLRQQLSGRLLNDGITGEEEVAKVGRNGRRWVIDPIDGTQAFITGVPAWCILLGLFIDEVPVAGIMHQPYLRGTFVATSRSGWFHRGQQRIPLRANFTTDLARATLYSTDPGCFAQSGSGMPSHALVAPVE